MSRFIIRASLVLLGLALSAADAPAQGSSRDEAIKKAQEDVRQAPEASAKKAREDVQKNQTWPDGDVAKVKTLLRRLEISDSDADQLIKDAKDSGDTADGVSKFVTETVQGELKQTGKVAKATLDGYLKALKKALTHSSFSSFLLTDILGRSISGE